MRQAVFICGLFATDIWWKKRKNWTHGHKGRKNSNSTLAMKHGQTHPKFWFWYCTVCISMAGPCRADTTNPARGWIYENIAHKIMEMSALITHTIQFFFTFIVDHLDAKQFAIRHFPEKIDHKYFLSKTPKCVFIIRWMAFYMVLTFSSVHFLFSLLCLFSFVLRFFFEILDFNLFYFQLYSTYIVHRYSDITCNKPLCNN